MKEIKQKDIPYRNFISKKRVSLKGFDKLKTLKPSICRMPHGKWYSIKHYWLENLRLEYNYDKINYKKDTPLLKYDLEDKFFHKLVLNRESLTNLKKKDKNKILLIKTSKDLLKFSKEYSDKKTISSGVYKYTIDWCKVSNDYAGLEIPYFLKKLHDLGNPLTGWYYGWDIPSGVIWNPTVIKSIGIY